MRIGELSSVNDANEVRHVVIIGGGITGLTAAYRLLSAPLDPRGRPVEVTVVESAETLGGKIRTSAFAGLPIEEGPDAYLARQPHATGLVRELGLADRLTHPATGHAAVWHGRLHQLPPGLVLGVPSGAVALARSRLLSVPGKIRAALEPFVPPGSEHDDSIGSFICQRFGREVHERLVDPLVGSIYAADTMNFSLDMVPQLSALAGNRSVLLGARRHLRRAVPTTDPVFETPLLGLGSLIETLARAIVDRQGRILSGTTVSAIEPGSKLAGSSTPRYRIGMSGRHSEALAADAVIICSPARASAEFVRPLDASVASAMATWTHASVLIVTLNATTSRPEQFAGLSGYLIPKPDQDRVTAVSFGSNKWRHWRPADDSLILRVSLGRDGVMTQDLVHEWDDERLTQQVLDEVSRHTGARFDPLAYRVSRWPDSFPQYRPGHVARVASLEDALRRSAPGVVWAGASWHGIGLPACIADANHAAGVTGQYLAAM